MTSQLEDLTSTYNQLCESSTQQVQQLEESLAKEEQRKVAWCSGFVVDIGGESQEMQELQMLQAYRKRAPLEYVALYGCVPYVCEIWLILSLSGKVLDECVYVCARVCDVMRAARFVLPVTCGVFHIHLHLHTSGFML